MEDVAQKIRKGLNLDVYDLQTWVTYNFLVLPEKDQQRIKDFIWRESRIVNIMSFSFPIIGYCAFAVNKYHFKFSFQANSAICLLSIFSLYRLFNYGLLKDKLKEYSVIYAKYGDEV